MQVNKWKNLFFILFFINIGIVIILIFTIFKPIKDNVINEEHSPLQDYVSFPINTTKDNLNKLINYYIEKEASGSPVNYQVILGDEVELYGTIPVFTEEIQMEMTFEPKALDNGDLILRQKSMAIGQMQLPATYILKFIEDRYRLPQGVIINPQKKIVYISMQKLKLTSKFKIRVKKFDLKKDDISFQLFVPTK